MKATLIGGFLILLSGVVSTAGAEVRTWTDSSGKFKIEAEIVKVSDGKVTLRKATDKKLKTLPLDKLSDADRAYVRRFSNGEGADTAAASNDPLAVPEGDVDQLLAFLERLRKFKPPEDTTREELPALQKKVVQAIFEASNRVLDGEEANKEQIEIAAASKLAALDFLGRTDPSDKVTKTVEAFPKQLTKLGLTKLAKKATTLTVTRRLLTASSPQEAERAIRRILNHLSDFGPFSDSELRLVQNVGRFAERLDKETAVKTYREIGQMLARDPRANRFAPMMLGTARRLDLVGNEMQISGITHDASPFDMSQFKGKVVLVDFWATWCGPCMREMPNIRRNYEKYHDLGFEVVAISTDSDLSALDDYVKRETPPWTVLVDEHPDNVTSMSEYYGVTAIPTTILIGADGKVITLQCRGPQLGKYLEELLGDASEDELAS